MRPTRLVGLIVLLLGLTGIGLALAWTRPLEGTLLAAALLAAWGVFHLVKPLQRRRTARPQELAALQTALHQARRDASRALRSGDADQLVAVAQDHRQALADAVRSARLHVGPALDEIAEAVTESRQALSQAARSASSMRGQPLPHLVKALSALARAQRRADGLEPYWEALRQGTQRGHVVVAMPARP